MTSKEKSMKALDEWLSALSDYTEAVASHMAHVPQGYDSFYSNPIPSAFEKLHKAFSKAVRAEVVATISQMKKDAKK